MPQLLTGTHPYLPPPPTPHHRIKPLTTPSSNNRFNSVPNRITLSYSKRILLPSPLKSASINEVSVQNNPEASSISDEILGRIRELVKFLPSIFPGGAWWNFSDEVDASIFGQPVTVWYALGKMWNLVARDRWVIFAAFAALIIAAVSEISIPHFLTASIFSAQGGDITVFHRNVRLLILLCGISGICSGIRGCFFGIANMILVKRMRETLYSSLLLQDISFFDNETVGDLTSRFRADCQQVSRVIGNDLNLILRNVLQIPEEGSKVDPKSHCFC